MQHCSNKTVKEYGNRLSADIKDTSYNILISYRSQFDNKSSSH